MRYVMSVWKASLIAGICSAALQMTSTYAEPAKKFAVGSPGGDSQVVQAEIFDKPFSERTGIQIEYITPSQFGQLNAMVKSGNVTAALWNLSSQNLETATSLGILERVNWSQVNPSPMFPESQNEYGYGYSYYSVGMSWKKDTQPIDTWADFWNVQKFPGKRCLPDMPDYVLPIALMADGVPIDKVYPLDIDRAFRSLNKIAPQVAVWWSSGQQPMSLLESKEVAYCMGYNGRVMVNPALEFTYNQALLGLAYFVVPKGADPKEVEAAMRLLHDYTLPEKQAIYAKRLFYSGSSINLADFLPPDLLAKQPTAPQNKNRELLADTKWWAKNGEKVQDRWQEWKLSR